MDNSPVHWNDTKTNNQKHHYLLPSPSCRALIIGESGCGKTSLMLKMLLTSKWLDYNSLFIFSKSLHQPEYKLLKSGLEKGYSKSELLDLIKNGQGDIDLFISELSTKRKQKCVVEYYEESESIPYPSEVDMRKKNIFIFDDIMTNPNQNKAEDFYTRGRHNNVSSIYVSQNYYKLPRQTIRSNTNVLILFSLSKKDLQHIHSEYISRDMDWQECQDFCNYAWRQPHGYVVINKDLPPGEGKYQVNLNKIYICFLVIEILRCQTSIPSVW